MKIAIVHDFFKQWGGAESVAAALHEMWPDAPIFTSYYTEAFSFRGQGQGVGSKGESSDQAVLSEVRLQTSWMQHLPEFLKKSNVLTPLLPFAFASFTFKDFDVVISSTASFAKSVDVPKPTVHICYCHTPPRFLYGLQREHVANRTSRIVEQPVEWFLRWLDQAAAGRVDHFIVNSQVVAKRIKEVYGRDSVVIYPPVDIDKFRSEGQGVGGKGDTQYFVVMGRLSRIKHFELAIEACVKLGVGLKVIGVGGDEGRLRSIAGPNVEFLGRLDSANASDIIAGAKALINPVLDEDFGIVPLEVLGAGKPVVAFASEAAQETLMPGVTGEFFYEPTAESLVKLLEQFDESAYNSDAMRDYAKQFCKERFESEMQDFVNRLEIKEQRV